jgi:hypothetical protein
MGKPILEDARIAFVAQNAANYPWNARVYFSTAEGLTPDTVCLVHLNAYEDPLHDELVSSCGPSPHGSLSAQDMEDIVENLKEQVASPAAWQIVAAIAHYLERDAFIVWEQRL